MTQYLGNFKWWALVAGLALVLYIVVLKVIK
jgi:hypothetical protein